MPRFVVGCVLASAVLSAGIVVSGDFDAAARARVLLPLIAFNVALVAWFVRRGNAEMERAHRASLVAERVYPVTGPSPLRASLALRGRGRCTMSCWLRGRLSASYEIVVHDAQGVQLRTLPLNAGSSAAAWANAPRHAPAVAYDEGGPGITLFTPEGEWEYALSLRTVADADESVRRDVRDELRVEVKGPGSVKLPDALGAPTPLSP